MRQSVQAYCCCCRCRQGMVHLENLIGMSHIEAARGEYSAYRLVVYVIIIVVYLSSCARVNVFFGFLLDSFSFVFIRARTSAGTVVFTGNSSFFFLLLLDRVRIDLSRIRMKQAYVRVIILYLVFCCSFFSKPCVILRESCSSVFEMEYSIIVEWSYPKRSREIVRYVFWCVKQVENTAKKWTNKAVAIVVVIIILGASDSLLCLSILREREREIKEISSRSLLRQESSEETKHFKRCIL